VWDWTHTSYCGVPEPGCRGRGRGRRVLLVLVVVVVVVLVVLVVVVLVVVVLVVVVLVVVVCVLCVETAPCTGVQAMLPLSLAENTVRESMVRVVVTLPPREVRRAMMMMTWQNVLRLICTLPMVIPIVIAIVTTTAEIVIAIAIVTIPLVLALALSLL
jgi:hypothetical protein